MAERLSYVRPILLVAALVLPTAALFASQASKLFKEGRKAERAGKMAEAYIRYSEAAAMAPDKPLYWLRSQAVRTRAALEAKPLPKPQEEPEPRLPADDGSRLVVRQPEFDSITEQEYADARKPQPPSELKAKPGRQNFDLAGDAKQVFERVARAFGLDCVFDGEYDAGKPFRFRMEQADYREALHALEAVTGSFAAPLGDRLFMVAKDTLQKRQQVEPYAAMIIPLPEPTAQQQFMEVVQAVQQTLALEKVGLNAQRSAVVIRDKVSRIVPARQLFEQLMKQPAEVAIEVEFVEVNRNNLLSYGLDWNWSYPLVPLGAFMHNKPTLPTGVTHLLTFGGGLSLFGIGVADPTILANATYSNAKTLLRAEVRSMDGQPAQLHVGSRYPILTAGYYGPSTPKGVGEVYVPPPSFTFEDLGLSLKVTPKVHGMDEVTLEIETEFKLLTGESVNDIPVVSNRKVGTKIRARLDQYAIIAGVMNASEARSISGLAGVATLPILGPLVRRTDKTKDNQDILVVLKPRLLRLPPSEAANEAVRVGSDTRPLTQL